MAPSSSTAASTATGWAVLAHNGALLLDGGLHGNRLLLRRHVGDLHRRARACDRGVLAHDKEPGAGDRAAEQQQHHTRALERRELLLLLLHHALLNGTILRLLVRHPHGTLACWLTRC